mmetsp:Transcript_81924/g.228331  ORF Transcript_81924/g.228331 Transcript_81924/m.228331 type:complete len:357 (-) Transcript_81924:1011-2081(-)
MTSSLVASHRWLPVYHQIRPKDCATARDMLGSQSRKFARRGTRPAVARRRSESPPSPLRCTTAPSVARSPGALRAAASLLLAEAPGRRDGSRCSTTSTPSNTSSSLPTSYKLMDREFAGLPFVDGNRAASAINVAFAAADAIICPFTAVADVGGLSHPTAMPGTGVVIWAGPVDANPASWRWVSTSATLGVSLLLALCFWLPSCLAELFTSVCGPCRSPPFATPGVAVATSRRFMAAAACGGACATTLACSSTATFCLCICCPELPPPPPSAFWRACSAGGALNAAASLLLAETGSFAVGVPFELVPLPPLPPPPRPRRRPEGFCCAECAWGGGCGCWTWASRDAAFLPPAAGCCC